MNIKLVYVLFAFPFCNQLYGKSAALIDSIPIKVIIHKKTISKVRDKGEYGITLYINDSAAIKLSEPINGFIYINDSILSHEKFMIEVYPYNYFLRKYKVQKKRYTFHSKDIDKATIKIRYKRTRYILRRLGLKNDGCHNGSVW